MRTRWIALLLLAAMTLAASPDAYERGDTGSWIPDDAYTRPVREYAPVPPAGEFTVAIIDIGADTDNERVTHVNLGGEYPERHGLNMVAAVLNGCAHCAVLSIDVGDVAPWGSDVADGIEYAVDAGVDLISISLAGPDSFTPMDRAIDYAEGAGIPVMAAAGNDATDAPYYPAAYATAAVAALDPSTCGLRSFSNYGDWITVSSASTSTSLATATFSTIVADTALMADTPASDVLDAVLATGTPVPDAGVVWPTCEPGATTFDAEAPPTPTIRIEAP